MNKLVAAALALALFPATAGAWEPQTTQEGLAEQAALASKLHKRLASLGFSGGLFEALTIPPADAPTLMAALHLLSPTHGAVPDGRGRQTALAWLAAGAALADVPAKHAANHFYDPKTKLGWTRPDRALFTGLADRLRVSLGRSELPETGVPAPDWVVAKANPFNLDEFYHQYEKAVSASTPGERSRHMAAALVAAGAMMHVLGDLGVPSRVRGDDAAQLDQLGGAPTISARGSSTSPRCPTAASACPRPTGWSPATGCATSSPRAMAAASPTSSRAATSRSTRFPSMARAMRSRTSRARSPRCPRG